MTTLLRQEPFTRVAVLAARVLHGAVELDPDPQLRPSEVDPCRAPPRLDLDGEVGEVDAGLVDGPPHERLPRRLGAGVGEVHHEPRLADARPAGRVVQDLVHDGPVRAGTQGRVGDHERPSPGQPTPAVDRRALERRDGQSGRSRRPVPRRDVDRVSPHPVVPVAPDLRLPRLADVHLVGEPVHGQPVHERGGLVAEAVVGTKRLRHGCDQGEHLLLALHGDPAGGGLRCHVAASPHPHELTSSRTALDHRTSGLVEAHDRRQLPALRTGGVTRPPPVSRCASHVVGHAESLAGSAGRRERPVDGARQTGEVVPSVVRSCTPGTTGAREALPRAPGGELPRAEARRAAGRAAG